MKFKINTNVYFTYPNRNHTIQGLITHVSVDYVRIRWPSISTDNVTYYFNKDSSILDKLTTTCIPVE